MLIYQLTSCNPSQMMDGKLSDAIEDALNPVGSLHMTFEGASDTARQSIVDTWDGHEGSPAHTWAPTWVQGDWKIQGMRPGSAQNTFRRWTFECEDTGDIWLIREMPLFGTEAFPE